MLVEPDKSDHRHDTPENLKQPSCIYLHNPSPHTLVGLCPTEMSVLHFVVLVLFPYSFLLLQQAEIIHYTGDIGAV